MVSTVDQYLLDGCGRCAFYATPQCKVHNWAKELEILRGILLSTELKEEIKWGVPCYTLNNKNVLILSAFKNYCAVSFFKGVLLKDDDGLLEKPGPNTHDARILKFTDSQQIVQRDKALHNFIEQAIAIEKSGKKVETTNKADLVFPDELTEKLNADATLKKAFLALTPGRQKGYVLHFSQPKQPKTREARIEKCIPKIMEGKGFNDR